MSDKTICIYHGNCADGFGAAWAVWKAHPNWEFYAGVHQDPPPDVSGRDVVMVDFSYKRPVIEAMLESAERILILDHHKSAMEDLNGLSHPKLTCIFDMERSGAGIAWDYYHAPHPRPKLINHIEDRDLWRFALPDTREIQATVFSYPYDFKVWDWLMLEAGLDQLRLEGQAIERKHHKDIAELVQAVTRPMVIGGYMVPMANLPYTLTSDAGHLLCGQVGFHGKHDKAFSGEHTHLFAGCYWDTPEGRVFSLRSRDDGADVGEIAKQYGGGGHKHASGFRVPFDELQQFETE